MLLSRGLIPMNILNKRHAHEPQQDAELRYSMRYSNFLLDLLIMLKRQTMLPKFVLDVLLQVHFLSFGMFPTRDTFKIILIIYYATIWESLISHFTGTVIEVTMEWKLKKVTLKKL